MFFSSTEEQRESGKKNHYDLDLAGGVCLAELC